MALPGCFLSVTFSDNVLNTPDNTYDVAGLNFAMVLHDERIEWPHRWTTWGLNANSLLLYQPEHEANHILVADEGHIYVLDDSIATDEDAGIHVVFTSGPLPELSDEILGSTMKRFQNVWWEVETPPSETGYEVTVTLTDVNDAANTVTRIVEQFTTRMHVDITLRCRQARLTLSATVGKDLDFTHIGYSFQQSGTRKTTRLA